jgi:hypothetical protein
MQKKRGSILTDMACPFPKYLLTYKSGENDTHIIKGPRRLEMISISRWA